SAGHHDPNPLCGGKFPTCPLRSGKLQTCPHSSGTGVSLVIAVAQALGRHMSVDLGSSKVAMPQQLLDAANVGAGVEQVGGETVPQRVRTGARVEARLGKVLLQQPPHTAAREPG